MKTIQQAINFVLVLLVFSQVISSLGIDLDEEMYETRDVSTAFRLLDFDTYYGSDSGLDERSGSLHLILNDEDLDDLEKDSPSTKVIIVTIHKYLTNSSLEIFAKEDSKVEGVVVLHGTDQEGSVDTAPDHFSPFSKIPQQFSGLHTSDETEWEWNPNSNLVFYTKWNFPIVYLSLEDESSEILKHAQENKEQDKTKYGISITGQMYGQYDSKVCLRRKYCDPIGGKSVYSFLGGQYNDSKPTTVVHCSIDSISMFPNYSPGYDSDSSSIAVLLAVFDALTDTAKTGAGMDWASTDRQIMFGFWEGEKWGHLGSKRFLKEVEEFKCTDYSSGKKSCETPYRYSLQFTEIDLNNIDESIELTQIGLPSTDLNAYHLYAHVERNDKEDESIELMQYIDDVSKNSSSESIQVTTISQASTSTPGIPPSSTESFIQQNSDIVSIVLSDFNEHFTNPYYGSVFDNGDLKNITQLVSVANLIARTIYAKALGITNLTTIPLELVVDESLLETLIDCLVTDNHCEFYENYFDSEYGEEYVTNYPGVYSEDTGRLQSIFIRNFLQTKTFPASFGSCESDSDCKEDEDGDDIYADCIKKKCYKRAAYYHQAYSQDIEYNTDTSKYDIDSKASNVWTESRWANLSSLSAITNRIITHVKNKRDFKLSKFSYLTERELKFVSQNKYKGKNDSLLYKYVTSPFCNWLVKNYIPDWMAPNLITLIGFIPIFIYGYVLSYYSPNMEEPLPRYILIFSPLTVIFYNICDNCDGKQARKTDNASPLGQMFDHGIDCVVGLYVIQNTTTTIQAGNTWIQYLILIGTLGCFYMATWDEYWCGNFYLGMFNGPNEGNLFVIILNFLVFIKPDLFAMNIFGKKLSDIALPPLLIALIPVLIVNISRVSKSGNLKQYGIKRAFITTIPNIAAVAVTLGWRILNPSLFDNYPRFTWTIVGFLFANLNFRILLAHLSKNFKNWYYAQSFWVLIYIPVLYHFFGMKFISEKLFIYTYASLLILAFVHLFTSVTIDVSSYLGIKVFKNKPVFIKKKKRTFLKNK